VISGGRPVVRHAPEAAPMTASDLPVSPAAVVRTFAAKAEPSLMSPGAEAFYAEALRELTKLGLPFLLAGTYALSAYTGITRPTKDLDVFCKAGDYPRILAHFQNLGYVVEIEDERWLGKVYKGEDFFDVIFASQNGTMPVGDEWFEHARQIEVFGTSVLIAGPTELVWSKCFIQFRERYDGADVAHTILKAHDQIDWRRLLSYMEVHWEVLFTHLINFRWIYPSERHRVPRWLMQELVERLGKQLELPAPQMKVCRGRMFSREDYEIDVKEWGFVDVGGESDCRNV
jgi:hypothetical protein